MKRLTLALVCAQAVFKLWSAQKKQSINIRLAKSYLQTIALTRLAVIGAILAVGTLISIPFGIVCIFLGLLFCQLEAHPAFFWTPTVLGSISLLVGLTAVVVVAQESFWLRVFQYQKVVDRLLKN